MYTSLSFVVNSFFYQWRINYSPVFEYMLHTIYCKKYTRYLKRYHGRKLSSRVPKENRELWDRTLTSRNTPVLHALDGVKYIWAQACSYRASDRVFTYGCPYSHSHTWGEDVVPYWTKDYEQCAINCRCQQCFLDYFSGHPSGPLSPRLPRVHTPCTNLRGVVVYFTS